MPTSLPTAALARVLLGACALFVLIYSSRQFARANPKEQIARRVPNYFSTDMTFGYRPADLIGVLRNYGEEDYEAHRAFISQDMRYPLFYSISLAVLIACLLPALPPSSVDYRRVHLIWLLPLVAALFDYGENLSMRAALDQFQGSGGAAGAGMMRLASLMTSLKLTALYATLFVVAVGLLSALAAGVRLLRAAVS